MWRSDLLATVSWARLALTKLARSDLHAGDANQPAADKCAQVRVDRDGWKIATEAVWQ